MNYQFVSHLESNVPSKVMKDLLLDGKEVNPFGKSGLTAENYRIVKEKKEVSYSDGARKMLVEVLKRQNPKLSKQESQSLDDIARGAFTVTTGHQLMVCGGSAFFEVKIASTIALAKTLSEDVDHPVIPIFWMASEDHDFEEIASFEINGHLFTWKHELLGGPVGRMSTLDLASQLETFIAQIEMNDAQRALLLARIEAYKSEPDLSSATRRIVREWAKDLGVLVLDGDDVQLKEFASHLWDKELRGELGKEIKSQTIKLQDAGYKAQVFPREVNLFSLESELRIRIDKLNHKLSPVHTSPNALLRPIFQEYVLPNLAYIGGGGELAYWLQLSSTFEMLDITMPVLYLRDSLLCVPLKIDRKVRQENLTWTEVMNSSKETMLKDKLGYYSNLSLETIELSKPLLSSIDQWNRSFVALYPELQQHAEALRHKMKKISDKTIEQRFRTTKSRSEEEVKRIGEIYDHLNPSKVFWERKSSYLDAVGILGFDPRNILVEKMSTIIPGTHILIG
tara:strand:- start:1146 stop:2672 length:1527 start_codon:yes stop_codon:yes gene_type:complete